MNQSIDGRNNREDRKQERREEEEKRARTNDRRGTNRNEKGGNKRRRTKDRAEVDRSQQQTVGSWTHSRARSPDRVLHTDIVESVKYGSKGIETRQEVVQAALLLRLNRSPPREVHPIRIHRTTLNDR